MRTRRYLQLDVFSAHPGAGNPLGVFVDAEGLDAAAMQAIAAWTNLSETIFLLPPDAGADYRVRIFTPRQELPFAGHPSVGAAWAVVDQGLARADGGRLVQQCGAGLLPVRLDTGGRDRRPSVRAPRATPVATPDGSRGALDAVLRALDARHAPHALIDNGPRWWCVDLGEAEVVRGLRPPLPEIAALSLASNAVGLAVCGRARASDHALVVRAFCPADGIPEDPVTGSANAALAAWLHGDGRMDDLGARYIASQGRELGRDGRVSVEIDAEGGIWIGGQVQPVIRGTLDW
ncbi:PhzF family phenazine biosynthesis protein [Luteimonas sp BLCC-B24]|uniref:PhzF family phenazine biosynthesis protein n=1 Tax=Luteimonas sp. BLCC-B24 TaxID=3025317 RepID=UPI00234C33D5|nr:PhzF family phenazine biosynthesis protein [Luteimonas sp. BLCC-B24]MDC7805939.1 PhzF family phenazine biosynthesis protein [Luteimonas sp. BLCC-B24]